VNSVAATVIGDLALVMVVSSLLASLARRCGQPTVIGLMFAVPYEVDFGSLRWHGRAVPFVALSALAVPMGLGIGLRPAFRSGFAAIGQPHEGHSLSNPVPIGFALAMGSAWATSSLGLRPVFGGFLASLTMRATSRAPEADVLRSMDQAREPAVAGLL
jgi:Kef-type K+ transport system membrane component KefB